MAGSSNILLFDSVGTNMLNDVNYASDGARTNGRTAGQGHSAMENKLSYQLTAVCYSIGQALSDLGYTISDASPAGIISAIKSGFSGVKNYAAKTADYTALAVDLGTLFSYTGTHTLALTAAATLGAAWYAFVRNNGTGTITIDPNGADTIDGSATITLAPGQTCVIICNATGFETVGRSAAGGVSSKSANYTAVNSDDKSLIRATGTWTLSLAAAATLGALWSATVRNEGTGNITIDPNGSETVNGSTTIIAGPGSEFTIFCDGSNFYTTGRLFYKSSNQTITSGGALTLAHGLGVIPTQVWGEIECTSAENGYSVGDIISFYPAGGNTTGAAGINWSVVPDATNLNINYGLTATNCFEGLKKSASAGDLAVFANSKWVFRARAEK